MKIEEENLGIILSGGAMRVSWVSGVLSELYNTYGIKKPKYIVGGSASSIIAAYYAPGQIGLTDEIWTKVLATNKFVNLARFWKILDFDFVINSLKNGPYALDTNALFSSETITYSAALESRTSKISYFSSKDKEKFWQGVKAAVAMPYFYGSHVSLYNGSYYDSCLTSYPHNHLEFLRSKGIKKFIVINCLHQPSQSLKRFEYLYHYFTPKMPRKLFAKEFDELFVPPRFKSDEEVIYICPTTNLCSRLERNPKKLLESIEQGRKDVRSLMDNDSKLHYANMLASHDWMQ